MLVDINQIIYLAVILGFGFLVLYIRRRAQGSKSLYKLTLMLSGIALFAILGGKLDLFIVNNLANLLLITLAFELAMRITPDNLRNRRSLLITAATLVFNILIVSLLASSLLNINPLQTLIFAIILTAVEYFLIDELRYEGDAANPLLLLFAFCLIYFLGLGGNAVDNTASFMQYVLIGLGVGLFISIIVFKLLRPHKITWVHELMLLSAAYLTYVIAEYLGGFGLLAIMLFGFMFGNSYVKKKSEMDTFSPFIFKSLEIFAFIMIGFIITFSLDFPLLWDAFLIYLAYLAIRFIVISVFYRRYSLQNKFLLTFAPKGVLFATVLLVFASRHLIVQEIAVVMMYILIFSLLASWCMEYIEEKKIERMDRFFNAIKNIRYGRKKRSKRNAVRMAKSHERAINIYK